MLRLSLVALILVSACRSFSAGAPRMSEPPDLILAHGTIYTGVAAHPRAAALAVRGTRIVAVGSDAAVRALAGPATQVIDLHGRTVLPALTDGHAHLYGLGLALAEVDLRGCPAPAACAARVATAAAQASPGEWILGRGWDQNRFPGGAFPTHAALDRVVSDRPVWVRRIDGHAGWANARALAAGGVTRATPDPPGGRILRGPDGAPTGVLVDDAMALVERAIPQPTQAERERALLRAQSDVLRHGFTEIHEMGIDPVTIAAYRALARDGRLQLRVYAFASGDNATHLDAIFAGAPDRSRPDAHFVVRGIKMYADGALGSRGAALLAPYSDDPGNRGLLVTPPQLIESAARRALAAGWQVAVHAIGDRANRLVLDAFEHAGLAAHPHARFRIEHAQIVALDDIPRFHALGVIASMQPSHATSDMPWAEARLGRARLAGAYAWRRFADAGVHLMGGSDFPIEEVGPLRQLYAAVTRTDAAGNPPGGWLPAERLTLDEAIAMLTSGAAYGAFEEGWRGRAAVGQAADLTLFDRDLLDAGPQALLEAHVDLTIIGGRIVYTRPTGETRPAP